MDNKFKQGLANQVFTEFENVKNLREDFISCSASEEFIGELEGIMDTLYSAYIALTRK